MTGTPDGLYFFSCTFTQWLRLVKYWHTYNNLKFMVLRIKLPDIYHFTGKVVYSEVKQLDPLDSITDPLLFDVTHFEQAETQSQEAATTQDGALLGTLL